MTKHSLDVAIDAAASGENRKDGLARIASACGVTKQFIHKMRREWTSAGRPPKALREYAACIELLTRGEVSAEDLYPGVQWLRDDSGAVTGYVVRVAPVDFSRAMSPQDAVQYLISAGWSEARIAAGVGTSQPTIHRLKHGRVTRGVSFEVGLALVQLAAKESAEPAAQEVSNG